MLKGKTAFVTGSNRGIGHAVLEAFAKRGINVIAHSRTDSPETREDLARLSQAYEVMLRPVFFDVMDADAMKQAVLALMREKMPVDILVNCAGILHERLLQMTSMSDVRKVFEVNFFAPYLLTQLISKLMMRNKDGGSIVNFSSVAAFDGIEGETAYGASKAALVAMSRSLAKELGRYNIRVNCVAPGVVRTDMTKDMPQQVLLRMEEQTYLRRLGDAMQVADVVAFLVSDEARHITGQTIRVDGGLN